MLSTSAVVAVTTAGLTSIGAIAILRSSYRRRIQKNEQVTPHSFHETQKDQIAKVLVSEAKFRETPLSLYQFRTCPYCEKLKSFLDYHQIQYKSIEVNPISKKELSSAYQKVPQLQLGENGPYLVDSSVIIDNLLPILDPKQPKRSEIEVEWSNRTKHLLGLLVINTNRNFGEAKESFSYAKDTQFAWTDKLMLTHFLPVAMYGITKKLIKPRLIKQGIYDPKIEEREALYGEVNHWLTEGVKDKLFQGENKPSLADLEYFGILKAQNPFTVFTDIKANVQQPQFDDWYQRMEKETRTIKPKE